MVLSQTNIFAPPPVPPPPLFVIYLRKTEHFPYSLFSYKKNRSTKSLSPHETLFQHGGQIYCFRSAIVLAKHLQR